MPKAAKQTVTKKSSPFGSRKPRATKGFYEMPFAKNMPAGSLGIDFTKLHESFQYYKMAVNIIECLACVGNKPSTNVELATVYSKLFPESNSYPGKIKDHMNQWRVYGERHGVPGIVHSESHEHCGFVCEEDRYHLVCKAKSGAGGMELVSWIDEEQTTIFNDNGRFVYPPVISKRPLRIMNKQKRSKQSESSASPDEYVRADLSTILPSPPVSEDGAGTTGYFDGSSSGSDIATTDMVATQWDSDINLDAFMMELENSFGNIDHVENLDSQYVPFQASQTQDLSSQYELFPADLLNTVSVSVNVNVELDAIDAFFASLPQTVDTCTYPLDSSYDDFNTLFS